ncbi:hypothetical protein Terro_2365 [Terriglobus roseus DSM 18391]|uniref:Uncharacterized protein n=1 Tax=Terriglobus roseus (strain DSM 18391 / NRRL B-41598 / KBS 63) TaxID=926566 RepID=I3ZHA8_TERRK|nr:hypothetical protein [Terriglobus roseus]AFL88626.1 hypothetical protein Terro_2365 [Terriglobus roseus DSM 18391]
MHRHTLGNAIGIASLYLVASSTSGQGRGVATPPPQVIAPLPSVYESAPSSSDPGSSPSVLLLERFKAKRRLTERKQAIEQAALLQSMTEQFQKDTATHQELTTADLKRLHEISRLAKSIQGKLED